MGVCICCVVPWRLYILHSKDRRKQKEEKANVFFSNERLRWRKVSSEERVTYLPHLSAQTSIADCRAVSLVVTRIWYPGFNSLSRGARCWCGWLTRPPVACPPRALAAGLRGRTTWPAVDGDPEKGKLHTATNVTTPDFNKVWTLSLVWKSLVND